MRQKGIKRLLCCLIPLMFAFFTLAVQTVTVKSTAAEESVSSSATASSENITDTYPFNTGVNAFQYAEKLIVPARTQAETDEFVSVLYKHNESTEENPVYPLELSTNGYLALHIQTADEVKLIFKLTQTDKTLVAFNGEATFMDESANISSLTVENGGVVTLPQGSRGALFIKLSGFAGANLQTGQVSLFSVHVIKNAVANTIKLGSLGYYANKGTIFNSLTGVGPESNWKIIAENESISLTQIPEAMMEYPFRKGLNGFEYGYNFTLNENPTEQTSNWQHIWCAPNSDSFDASSKGYFAVQLEAKNEVGIYPYVFDGTGQLKFDRSPVYYANEYGKLYDATVNSVNWHIELPKGRHTLILPASVFTVPDDEAVQYGFNWNMVTCFVLDIDGVQYPKASVNVGEILYYANDTAEATEFLSLQSEEDSAQLTHSEGITKSLISRITNDMETGVNAFAYGAHWSGIQQTDGNAWAQFFMTFDSVSALDSQNGILAIQMEIICNDTLFFLPSVWDGSGQSVLTKSAVFISETGEETVCNVFPIDEYTYIKLPSCTGVLLMSLSDFEKHPQRDAVNWEQVTTAVITVNTTNAYDFQLKIGEVGYYANNFGSGMTKLLTKSGITDFRKYSAVSNGEVAGVIDRIPNKNIAPTIRYASVSTTGDIGLIYYVELPNESYEEVYGNFTVEGESESKQVKGVYRKAQGCFAFIASVYPKNYQKAVTLTVGEKAVYRSSVQAYAEQLQNTSNSQQAKDLVTQLLNYCEAVRKNFDANETVDDRSETVDLSQYKARVTDTSDAITVTEQSLTVESKTAINVYFTATSAYAGFSVTDSSGNPVPYVTVSYLSSNGDGTTNYRLTIDNVVARNLNETYTVKIGERVDGEIVYNVTVECSALSYAENVIANDKTDGSNEKIKLFNAVIALYHYSVAADAYAALK